MIVLIIRNPEDVCTYGIPDLIQVAEKEAASLGKELRAIYDNKRLALLIDSGNEKFSITPDDVAKIAERLNKFKKPTVVGIPSLAAFNVPLTLWPFLNPGQYPTKFRP